MARQYQKRATIDYGRVTIDTPELRQRQDLARYKQALIRRTTNWYELIGFYYSVTTALLRFTKTPVGQQHDFQHGFVDNMM